MLFRSAISKRVFLDSSNSQSVSFFLTALMSLFCSEDLLSHSLFFSFLEVFVLV